MNKMKLIEDDIKGATVDKSLQVAVCVLHMFYKLGACFCGHPSQQKGLGELL